MLKRISKSFLKIVASCKNVKIKSRREQKSEEKGLS
jgi:hypothetical protein